MLLRALLAGVLTISLSATAVASAVLLEVDDVVNEFVGREEGRTVIDIPEVDRARGGRSAHVPDPRHRRALRRPPAEDQAALGHDPARARRPGRQADRGHVDPARPEGADPRARGRTRSTPPTRSAGRARPSRRSSGCSRTRRARTSRSTTSSASTSAASGARSTTSAASTSTSTAATTTTTRRPRAGEALRDDRRPARLPEAQGPGRARLRPLPPRRQRLLPRLAPAGLPAPDLAPGRRPRSCSTSSKRKELAHIFGRYFEVDKSFVATSNLIGLAQTRPVPGQPKAPVNEVRFPAYEAKNPAIDSYLYVKDADLRKTVDEFMTGKGSSNPRRLDDDDQARATPTAAAKPKTQGTSRPSVKGLEQARDRGREHGRARREPGQPRLPVLLPGPAQDRLALRRHQAAHLRASATRQASCTARTGSCSTRARSASTTASRG